jgi:crossover junction endodeoxyribonuclease RuvC
LTVIIGIDPGSCITGYGVICWQDNQSHYLDSGCLRLAAADIASKLQQIYTGLRAVMTRHAPSEAAIEQIFMHENPGSALKLGQARGVAIVALGLPVAEYSARQVKQSVAGYGAAEKSQVQHMVKQLLKIPQKLQADAADALAVALCHAHARFSLQIMGRCRRNWRSGWRNFNPDISSLSR